MLQMKGKLYANSAQRFGVHAVAGENIEASVSLGTSKFGGTFFILTQYRLVELDVTGELKASYPLNEIESLRLEDDKSLKALYLNLKEIGERRIGLLPDEIKSEFPLLLQKLIDAGESSPYAGTSESTSLRVERYNAIPTNRAQTKKGLPKHLIEAIRRNSQLNETPLMLITNTADSTDGSLIVYADRCVISKSGFVGSLMSGSLGGAREATFYFRDITGIEYNSGILNGVLEILTASYDGGNTKDFWQGFLQAPKGLSKNDPRVQSNTLPLDKLSYKSAKPLIDRLRTMINEAKDAKVTVVNQSQSTGGGVAEEIQKLAELLEKGLIDEEEFKAAKAKLLGG